LNGFRDRTDRDVSIELGSDEQVMHLSACEDHKSLIAHTLRIDNNKHRPKKYSVFRVAGKHTVSIVGYIASDVPSLYAFDLHLISDSGSSTSICTGRIPHQKWIDRSLLWDWRTSCEKLHSGKCDQSFRNISATIRPTYLVDTWLNCLVESRGSESYIALSYIWGGAHVFRALKGNKELLLRHQALAPENCEVAIPNTIRDAMRWVQVLHERYLWVDSLCILQDDENKHLELLNMSAIYANATITIVAAQGNDANYGLRGLSGCSKARRFDKPVYSVGLARISAPAQSRVGYPNRPSSWRTRGWTLQEQLFSRRKLIFEGDVVCWDCEVAVWWEDVKSLESPQRSPDDSKRSRRLVDLIYPDVVGLVYLLANYNIRELTYPEDALNAFHGLAQALNHSYSGGFVSGLPADFFDIALLWRGTGTLSRRVSKSVEGRCSLPSWSWAGWKGSLNTWMWTEAAEWIKYSKDTPCGSSAFATPLTHWSYKQSITDVGVLIHNVWHEFKSRYSEGQLPCPPGWARHHVSESPNNDRSRTVMPRSQWFYKFKSEPHAEFWYPLPIAQESVKPALIITPFISCITKRAWLVVSEPADTHYPMVSLRDATGRWAGVLQPDECYVKDENDNQQQPLRGARLEFVEIVAGVSTKFQSLSETAGIHPEISSQIGDLYHYYYVLWIEWENGIAYRKGIGQIWKDMWEEQDREVIDLIMG
jgi:hypothetical protein